MKLTTCNNNELVIQANPKKAGDYSQAVALAEYLASEYGFDFACNDTREQWVQLFCFAMQGQAAELRDIYKEAKQALLQGVK